MSQQTGDTEQHSLVLDTDVSALPEVGNISVFGIVAGMLGWSMAFAVGVAIGGVVPILASLGVAFAASVAALILAAVTPSYCSTGDYLGQKIAERRESRVRLHNAFGRGGEE